MIFQAVRRLGNIYKLKRKKAFLYIFRLMLYPIQTWRWLYYLNRNLVISEYNNLNLDLASKIYRPFLRPYYTVGERVSHLIKHFDIMMANLPIIITRSIFNGEAVELARVQGSHGSYCINIFRDSKFGKEGELSISLTNSQTGTKIATVSFIFGSRGDGNTILILGGLQGPAFHRGLGQDGKRCVIEATKSLGGLRPKRAVMEATAALARAIGAVAIYAPSNVNHVSRELPTNKRKIYSNYNEFWAELGGILVSDGDYMIPVSLPQRNREQVPTKKRKGWWIRIQHVRKIQVSVSSMIAHEYDGCAGLTSISNPTPFLPTGGR